MSNGDSGFRAIATGLLPGTVRVRHDPTGVELEVPEEALAGPTPIPNPFGTFEPAVGLAGEDPVPAPAAPPAVAPEPAAPAPVAPAAVEAAPGGSLLDPSQLGVEPDLGGAALAPPAPATELGIQDAPVDPGLDPAAAAPTAPADVPADFGAVRQGLAETTAAKAAAQEKATQAQRDANALAAEAAQERLPAIEAERKAREAAEATLTQATNNAQAKLEELADLIQEPIDTGRAFADTSVGGKIGLTILGFMSGALSQGGPNQFIQMLDTMIDRDINAQLADKRSAKAAAGQQQTILQNARARFDDDITAAKAAKLAVFDRIATELEVQMQGAKDDAILARNQEAIAVIEEEGLKLQSDVIGKENQKALQDAELGIARRQLKLQEDLNAARISKLRAEEATARAEAAGATGGIPGAVNVTPGVVNIGSGGFSVDGKTTLNFGPKNKDTADEVRTTFNAMVSAVRQLQTIQALGVERGIPKTERRERIARAVAQILDDLIASGGRAISDQDVVRRLKSIGTGDDPGAFLRLVSDKTMMLKIGDAIRSQQNRVRQVIASHIPDAKPESVRGNVAKTLYVQALEARKKAREDKTKTERSSIAPVREFQKATNSVSAMNNMIEMRLAVEKNPSLAVTITDRQIDERVAELKQADFDTLGEEGLEEMDAEASRVKEAFRKAREGRLGASQAEVVENLQGIPL